MKKLILLDTAFPYEKVEPFLESEINYFPQDIHIYIATCLLKDDSVARPLKNENVTIIGIKKNVSNVIFRRIIKFGLSIFVVTNKYFYLEILDLLREKRLNFRTFRDLILFVSQGDRLVRIIKRYILKNNLNSDDIIFYSYWMHVHSYVAVRLKEMFPKSTAISRCHRYDLYEEVNPTSYIPMRNYILPRLNRIFSISIDGLEYINFKYSKLLKNVDIAKLGTKDHGLNPLGNINSFNIVSCSWVVPVKRVSKIIEALSCIHDVNIKWTHFGDGVLFDEIRYMAQNTLPHNIQFELPGAVNNEDILKYYKNNPVNVFINVSESEGIPVSIMEVISFGIPVIATDVGGVREIIVDEHNGLILEKDFANEELIFAIRKIKNMDEDKYNRYRFHAREYWNLYYNADHTYPEFIDKLLNL